MRTGKGPPHPAALRPPSPARGEGKCLRADVREVQDPSPLAGEGDGRQSRPAGEGEAARTSPLNRARGLRLTMTGAEHALWRILRGRRFARTEFRRQVPIGPYVADFVCYEARLLIEADGGQHCESARDAARDAWFARQGFRTLRFWNNDILLNPEGVAIAIAEALLTSGSPPKQEKPLTRPLCGHPLSQGERVTAPEQP